jgi:hypothetical protein
MEHNDPWLADDCLDIRSHCRDNAGISIQRQYSILVELNGTIIEAKFSLIGSVKDLADEVGGGITGIPEIDRAKVPGCLKPSRAIPPGKQLDFEFPITSARYRLGSI